MIEEGSSFLNENRKVNSLTLNSNGNIETIFKSLEKDFGKPIIDSCFQVFNVNKSEWSNEPIIMRVEIIETISMDNDTIKHLFFTAETNDKEDLLQKNTESQISIKKYLAEKYVLLK